MTEIINIPLSSAVERVRRHGDPVPHAALNPSLNIFRAPSIDATYCANNDWTFLYSAVYRLAYKMLDLHDRFEYWDKFNLTRREPLYLLFQ